LFEAEIPRKVPAESAAAVAASPQDATPNKTGYQRPSLLAAIQSPTTEAKEASPSTDSTEQEKAKEPAEKESPCTEMPAPEPSSMVEGPTQIPQDQEEEVAPSVSDLKEGSSAFCKALAIQLTSGHAVRDDGAIEAPVTTEIEPEQPMNGRQTEEPTAEAKSDEAHITTTSDDDTSEGPVATETKPGELVSDSNRQPIDTTTRVESYEVPGTTTSQDRAHRSTVANETTTFEPLGNATMEPTAGTDSG
jgi:hypothetical protein